VTVTPEPVTLQGQGWCALTLLVREGTGFQSAGNRILLTAAGYTDNFHQLWSDGMGPTNGTSMVASTNWGSAPVLLEGIAATVHVARAASSVAVWALDACGRRKTRVPVFGSDSQATFAIDRIYQTGWYEMDLNAAHQGTSWSDWRAAHFSETQLADAGISGPDADPDGDGFSNLFEYAIGSNPLVADAGDYYTAGIAASDLFEYLTVTTARNPDATDVRFQADVSADLAQWTNDVTILSDTPTVFSARDNTPVSAAPRRFLRLRVISP
jgi:hypothetical protein